MGAGKTWLVINGRKPTLGGKPIELKKHCIMLGYTVEPKIQGSAKQFDRGLGKARAGIIRLDVMHIFSSKTPRAAASQLYYTALVESVLTANLTVIQLIGNLRYWEDDLLTLQASCIRRTFGAGTWCPAIGLVLEAGWRPTAAIVVEAKLSLYDRIFRLPDHEYAKIVQMIRVAQVEAGDNNGLDKEVAQVWEQAGQPMEWERA